MVMSVNTNISSLNAQNNLAKSQSKLATAIERLSSGMKINSAKDDAAGLAISTRFTTQINGLNQAVSNANDGISLAQTTESALNEVTNNMQRIRTLAVQSANATNSQSDRDALDAEVQQRLSEITRISQQTTFNGRHVLDGSFGSAAFQIGANVGETISVNLSQGAGAKQVGQIAQSATSDISSMFASPAGLTVAAGDLTVGGQNVAAGSYTDAASLAAALNTAAAAAGYTGTGADTFATVSGNEIQFANNTASAIALGGTKAAAVFGAGVTSVAAATTGAATPATASSSGLPAGKNAITLAAGDLTIDDGTGGGAVSITGTFKDATELAAAINAAGFTASAAGGELTIDNSANANPLTVAGATATALGLNQTVAASSAGTASSGLAAAISTNANSYELAAGDLTITSGSGTAQDITGTFADATALKAAIDTAATAAGATGFTTTVNSGELDFSNAGASTVTFGGTLAGALGISTTAIAAATPGTTTDGAATTTGVNTAVSAAATGALSLATGDLTINGTDLAGSYKDAQSLVDAINSKGIDGVSAYYDSSSKSVHLNSQSDLTVNGTKAGTGAGNLGFSGAGATAIATGSNLAASDVKSVAGANDTISRIDAALGTISSMRSDLGAVQNRFSSTIANLQTISQNLSSSRSQIQDADFAAETANMSSANILQQAGVSVLAQANSSTQAVLKLLQ
ncbi:flagellin [Frateuria terrea]|uniref:Flagellin n=1 Tax=Frateuria terrea TaxID=529704 RepID=A0A1H6W6C9_9GAMM|nr:flagellin [Frateuria terrea]SEJ08072.1 flagellin [Frateuria terrea]SFP69212.1 flagellin [Frateuria terrea]